MQLNALNAMNEN